jgi:aspartyl-tRNA(Asn)/glutamyl-tRNA(Gln) amidotransferase subunit C
MATHIDARRVGEICHLARLKLSDSECAVLGAQLSSIVSYVEQLNEVDTSSVEPMAHPLSIQSVFREDEPQAPLGLEKALANAPALDGQFFKVPKVLDQTE